MKKLVSKEEQIDQAIENLDNLSLEAVEIYKGGSLAKGFKASLQMARLVGALEDSIKPVLPEIKKLMNKPLGFLTDKDPNKKVKSKAKDGKDYYPTPYTDEQLVPIIAESIIKGVRVTGNQFNVISGRCYITREGFQQKFDDLEGFENYKESFEFDKGSNFANLGDCRMIGMASWVFKGEKQTIKEEIIVRTYGMGPDAAIGKAQRKLRARVWSRVTNSTVEDGDVTDPNTVDVGGKPEETPRPEFPKSKTTPKPMGPTIQDAEEVKSKTDTLMNTIIASGIEPEFFIQAISQDGVDVPGGNLAEIHPALAEQVLKSWSHYFTAAKRLKEGGGK